MTSEFWQGKRVLVTGHTGFKGSWLCLWLQELGAIVYGYSIDVPTEPSLYASASVGHGMTSNSGDVRNLDALHACFTDSKPDIVIHMAAQSLVRHSYQDPVGTYSTNVLGTVNVLEAVRQAGGVRVVIIVTSDKCYENKERSEGYREGDPMGGYDPYSSSKGCAELVTSAYRSSFFNAADFDSHGTAIASVRAGNVIGGGDWAQDRLIPDVFAALTQGRPPTVRNPHAIRPWQFVMDPLNGYLTLAERLWATGPELADAWNFGPDACESQDVGSLVKQLARDWGMESAWHRDASQNPHEATYLTLDSSKARSVLSWAPRLNLQTTLDWIVAWYRDYVSSNDARSVTISQIRQFHQLTAK